MNTTIELHDSVVASIDWVRSKAVVHFTPAYLHKSEGRPGYDSGTGWVQDAKLIFLDACIDGEFPDLPGDLMDGAFTIGGERHDNQIPVPLASAAPAELRLIFDSVHALRLKARCVQLLFVGEPRNVEDFRP